MIKKGVLIVILALLLVSSAYGVVVSHRSEDIRAGTFGDNVTPSGNYSFMGRVGIGTTSPLNDMHIYSGDSTGDSSVVNYVGGDNLVILENDDHTRMVFATPSDKHQVIGFSNNETAEAGAIRYAHNIGAFDIKVNNSWALRINEFGNVGIGSTTPSQKLHVEGNMNVTGTIYGDGSGLTGLPAGGQWTDAGSYIYANNNNEVVVTDTGNIQTGNNSYVYSQKNLTLQSQDGNHRIILSGTTNEMLLKEWGNIILNAGLQNGGSEYQDFQMNGDSKMRILANGNVGVGTTNPSSKLEIKDNTDFGTGIYVNVSPSNMGTAIMAECTNGVVGCTAIKGVNNYGGGVGVKAEANNGNAIEASVTNSGYALYASSGDNYFGGNVGIGTTTPGTDKVEIAGGALRVTGAATSFTENTGAVLDYHSSEGARLVAGSSEVNGNNSLWFKTYLNGGYVNAMTIDESGNVGIGTTSPQEMLELYKDNQDIAIRIHDTGDTEYKIGTDSADNNLRIVNTNGNADIGASVAGMVVNPAGNVGIGTTSPTYKLQVEGRGLFNGSSTYELGVGNGINNYWFGISSGGSDLVISDGLGTEKMRLTNGGNVGIGTTSPGSKLDIVTGSTTGNANVQIGVVTDGWWGTQGVGNNFYGWGTNTQPLVRIRSWHGEDPRDKVLYVDNVNNPSYPYLVVQGGGNVGIGINESQAKLHLRRNSVNGNLNEVMRVDGNTMSSGVAGSGILTKYYTSGVDMGSVGGYSNGTNYGMGIWGGSASGNPDIWVANNGDICIGVC